MITRKADLLAELARGRSVALFDGMDSTPSAEKLRWAIVETGETVTKNAIRYAKDELATVRSDLFGQPMQYGPAAP